MQKVISSLLIIVAVFMLPVQAITPTCSSVSIPYTFTSGTKADAAQVNSNFTSIESEVNNLCTDINALDTAITALTVGNCTTGTTVPASCTTGQKGACFLDESDMDNWVLYYCNGSNYRQINVTDIDGTLVIDATTTANGAFTFANTATFNMAVTAVSTTNLQGAVDCDSTLNVDGASTFTTISATTINATMAVDFDTTLNVDGNTTLIGTLGVTGDTTVQVLNAQMGVDFDTTLNVDGNTTLGGTLDVTGATDLMSTVTVGSTLTATGTITANGGLSVASSQTIDFNSNAITEVADPTNDQDAATKKYVDDQAIEIWTGRATSAASLNTTVTTYDLTEVLNTNNSNFSFNTSTDEVTVSDAGTYEISIYTLVENTGGSANYARVIAQQNGSAIVDAYAAVSSGEFESVVGSRTIMLSANDVIRWRHQKGGSNFDFVGTNLEYHSMEIKKIGS